MKGVEFLAPVTERYEQILTPEAVAFVVGLQRTFNARRKELLEARRERQKRLDAGERPDFLKETQAYSRVRMDGGAAAGRHARPARGDHRAGRPQDDHQRAELRREGLHGRLRGLEHADVEQPDRRSDQSARCHPADDYVCRSRQTARATSSTKSPRCCSFGRAAGISTSAT